MDYNKNCINCINCILIIIRTVLSLIALWRGIAVDYLNTTRILRNILEHIYSSIVQEMQDIKAESTVYHLQICFQVYYALFYSHLMYVCTVWGLMLIGKY